MCQIKWKESLYSTFGSPKLDIMVSEAPPNIKYANKIRSWRRDIGRAEVIDIVQCNRLIYQV